MVILLQWFSIKNIEGWVSWINLWCCISISEKKLKLEENLSYEKNIIGNMGEKNWSEGLRSNNEEAWIYRTGSGRQTSARGARWHDDSFGHSRVNFKVIDWTVSLTTERCESQERCQPSLWGKQDLKISKTFDSNPSSPEVFLSFVVYCSFNWSENFPLKVRNLLLREA
jgi:hypothetical protein